MAAVTPDAASPERTHAVRLQGLRHQRFFFIATGVDNADTWDSNIQGIRYVAWEPRAVDSAAHSVAVTFQSSDGPQPWRVTFNCAVANRMGILHVWSMS